MKNFLNSKKRYLKNFGSEDSATTFKSALDLFDKFSSEKDIVAVLNDKKNSEIVPSLMDILGNVGSYPAFKAVNQVFGTASKVLKGHWAHFERYLWGLSAAASFPEKDLGIIAKEMLKIIQNDESKIFNGLNKLKETWLMTLGSLAHTLEVIK